MNGKMSIQLNCTIGKRTPTHTLSTPPKEITKHLSKIVFDLCVNFSSRCVWLLLQPESMNVCLWRWIISELMLFHIIENLIHKHTAPTHAHTRTHAHHSAFVRIKFYMLYNVHSTFSNQHVLVFWNSSRSKAYSNVAGSSWPIGKR